jgi:hypothetical protein
MTTADKIALASAIVAALSIVINIIQAVAIQKLNRKDVAKRDVVEALRNLQQRLEYSQFFNVGAE